MDTNGRLVVGSHNKINAEDIEKENCECDDLENGFYCSDEHRGDKDGNGDELDRTELPKMVEESQPLSRKLPIPSIKINPYRIVVLLRVVIIGLFLHYRILHPAPGANGLWLTSVACEIWLAVTWIFDQCTKLSPINRETYLDRLSLRYEKEGKPSELPPVDVFVTTVDTKREPPLLTANTVLSILAVDYPIDRVACYVSDDGSSLLSYETLCVTSEFARKWVPYCKKFCVEPRAPEWHFSDEVEYLGDKVTFDKEHTAMKSEYNEFKIRINSLVATAQNANKDGKTMQDGTPWPGNNVRDHPGMIQVFLGQNGVRDVEGNELPRLVYVSREKRPGFDHHKKAGSLNSMLRLSAITSNAPYVLNLDCDHYINDSKALKDAMCFMMDPQSGNEIGYVQYPQRYYGIDPHDRYSNRNYVFFDINMKGLDGIQGPLYIGTGCVFRRQAFYCFDSLQSAKTPGETCNCLPKWHCCCFGSRKGKKGDKTKESNKKETKNNSASTQIHIESTKQGIERIKSEKTSLVIPQIHLETIFGQSPVFIASTLSQAGGVPPRATSASFLKEAIHVISCGYENETEWGKEVGWIYGSVSEDILTGFKMHSDGWQSVYSIPKRPAFLGSAPINLSDRLHQACRWALGSVEIMLSRFCPVWFAYGRGLKILERFAYLNCIIYPLSSLPLVIYCTLPAIALLTGIPIFPASSIYPGLIIVGMFSLIFLTCILEGQWGGVGIWDWWRNEQFWVIGGSSAHFLALIQGTLKVICGVNINFIVTPKAAGDEEFSELYVIKWTPLLIPPIVVMSLNIFGVIVAFSEAIIFNGYESWGKLFGRLFFSFWVIVHLYPFLQGFMGKHERLYTVLIWLFVVLATIFSLLWINFYPHLSRGGNGLYPLKIYQWMET